jgi:2-oxoglutarate dehydrogenase E2 component (dihydrolipoamide succinyltransferase)
VAAGEECAIGQILAVIGPGEEGGPTIPSPTPDAGPAVESEAAAPVLSDRARILVERYGITPEQVRATGLRVIREADVSALVDDGPVPEPGRRVALSPNQIAVKAAVEKSHREIPAAFAALTVGVDTVLARAEQESRTIRALVGVTEIVVRAVADQRASFPQVFATLGSDGFLRVPAVADIGITLDAGNGLFVPVLRDVEAQTTAELAANMMRFRRQAMTGRFTAEELRGPGVVIALNNANSVAQAVPIIFPGNVACLSLGAPQRVVELNESGGVRIGRQVQLGLAYDHRVINGRAAGAFLGGLKEKLENPDSLFTG